MKSKKEYRGIIWDGSARGLCHTLKVPYPIYLLFKREFNEGSQENFIDYYLNSYPGKSEELDKFFRLKKETDEINISLRKDALKYLAIREISEGKENDLIIRNELLSKIGLKEMELKERIEQYFDKKGLDVRYYDLKVLCQEIVGII